MKSTVLRKSWRVMSASCVSMSIMLSGCQTTGFPSLGQVNVDPNDPCSSERTAFRDSDNYFTQEIVTGAVIGAVGGAALGLLLSHATGGVTGSRGGDIAAGAIAGAVAGATTGYLQARAQTAQDAEALASSVEQDIASESTNMDRATVNFLALKSCRMRAAETIKSQFQAKTLTREEAEARLQAQKTWFREELDMANALNVRMKSRQGEFLSASNELMKTSGDAKDYNSWRKEQADTVVYMAKSGRVRSQENSSSSVVASLSQGQKISAASATLDATWVRVLLDDGKTGFVSRSLISKKPVAAASRKAEPTVTPAKPALVASKTADKAELLYVAHATATETLPEKRQEFEQNLASAEADQAVAFQLN